MTSSPGGAATVSAANLHPKLSCTDLKGTTIAAGRIGLPTRGATVEQAERVGAAGRAGEPDYVPEHCLLTGAIAPVDPQAPPIRFSVAMPQAWNGMSLQIGGNGMNGFIPFITKLNRDGAGSPSGPLFPPDAPFPIAHGYATYGDDSGHGGARIPGSTSGATPQGPPPPPDTAWMRNEESRRNFAHEHIKKTHDVAMALLERFYGMQPRVKYFGGESQGGRAALNAIARYGADYDGVLVSVPLAYFTGIHYSPLVRQIAQMQPGAWIPLAKLPAIERESIRQCDALDGLADGVILNYQACQRLFDPTVTPNPMRALRCPQGIDSGDQCLSDAQIALVDSFRAPTKIGFPLANGESDWPGEPPGSESVLRWLTADRAPTPEAVSARGDQGGLGALLNVRDLDPSKFDWAKYKAEFQVLSALIDAPADWTRFLAKGGKVIFHTTGNDFVTNPRGHMRLFEAVAAKAGPELMERNVRFYVTPAADHGSRGYSFPDKRPQPRHANLLDPLFQWVEQSKTPPDAITQTLKDTKPPYTVSASRPLCRYPQYPHYNGGNADPARMESYTCKMP
ncbi:MAG: tannase/feruloyl esterase family alpha/beta hydrolase [Steroidobacteraceae bacterium]